MEDIQKLNDTSYGKLESYKVFGSIKWGFEKDMNQTETEVGSVESIQRTKHCNKNRKRI